MMAKKNKPGRKTPTKKRPAKRAYTKRTVLPETIIDTDNEILIEKNPPPLTRYKKPGLAEFLIKIEKIAGIIKPGEAFIIPITFRNSTARYLKDNFADKVFWFREVIGNKDVLRVYCVPIDKKKK
jgi:hypothetical protein